MNQEIEGILNDVFTASEAAQLWGLNESTVRKAVLSGKFILGTEFRKAGGTVLITKQAMERIYGAMPNA